MRQAVINEAVLRLAARLSLLRSASALGYRVAVKLTDEPETVAADAVEGGGEIDADDSDMAEGGGGKGSEDEGGCGDGGGTAEGGIHAAEGGVPGVKLKLKLKLKRSPPSSPPNPAKRQQAEVAMQDVPAAVGMWIVRQ